MMDLYFRDRDVKVLVVDPSGASRTLLSEVVRSLGFGDVLGVPNLKDALGVMEVEKVRWLITPMFAEQNENLLQVLNLFCNVPDLKQLRISALVEDGELDLLPACFEKGLLAYHKKPFTKDSLSGDLRELLSRFEKYNWQSSLTSGSYLRQALMTSNNFPELLSFEKQLLKLHPTDLGQYLNLAVPLVKTGKVNEAKEILCQVRKIEPDLEATIVQIADVHLGGSENLKQGEGQGVNLLGLKSAVVVDGDSAATRQVKDALHEMGVEQVHVFDDGEAAYKHITDIGIPDLIVQEWRIPKLAGPLLLQRVQEEGAKNTPVILISSLIQKEDLPFVREMGVANHVNKPFQKKDLIQAIIWTIQQDRQPTEQGSMERKMRQLISDKKYEEAADIKSRFMADKTIGTGAKEIIEAEFAYAAGDNEKARDFCVEAIKHAGESIFILNLLGKTLINMREFETALKCFQKAQSISPLNLERLCQIAEIHTELGDKKAATEILEEAKDIDPDSQRVQEAEAKALIANGESGKAKKLLGKLKAMDNVVAYMNNRSVAMSRCGMILDGIEGYRKTLESIPDERPDIKGVVLFNMAFAYIRVKQLPDAKDYLEQSLTFKETKVYAKAGTLLKRVNHAIAKGIQLNIAESDNSALTRNQGKLAAAPNQQDGSPPSEQEKASLEEAKEIAKSKVLATVDNKPGDMACHMIYKTSLSNAKASKMLEGRLRFSVRKAIERAESMGADKLMAGGS